MSVQMIGQPKERSLLVMNLEQFELVLAELTNIFCADFPLVVHEIT